MEKRKSLQKNQCLRLHIDAMTLEGMGVARHNGQVVFVPAAAPGDVVEVIVVKVRKRLAFGKIAEIITPSSDRIASDCVVYPQCGGCRFRHVDYEVEAACKNKAVEAHLQRLGGVELHLPPLERPSDLESYRNKAIYPVAKDRTGRPVAGFYAPRSHRVQDCARCRLQPEAFDRLRQVILDFCRTKNISIYDEAAGDGLLRHIYLRRGHYSGEIMACLVLAGDTLPHHQELVSLLRRIEPSVRSILIMKNTQRTNVILTNQMQVLYGDGLLSDTMCGLSLTLSPLSFYQVNTPAAERIYQIAKSYAGLTGEETVLDFYCGAGVIGLSMARQAKTVIGVEVVPEAVANAAANAKASRIPNTRFLCADAGAAARQLIGEGIQPDVILLDPPRTGCSTLMLSSIAALTPRRIVYISCNSAALARDIAFLRQHQYVPIKTQTVDLFPRTGHVETVCLLSKPKEALIKSTIIPTSAGAAWSEQALGQGVLQKG